MSYPAPESETGRSADNLESACASENPHHASEPGFACDLRSVSGVALDGRLRETVTTFKVASEMDWKVTEFNG
jgi:hypothetical protein